MPLPRSSFEPGARTAPSFVAALCILGLLGELAAQDLVVNEVMSSNGETLRDEDGDSSDWVEIHNPGASEVQLLGHGLSDSYKRPLRWTFPEMVLPPGGYLLIFCSGKDRAGAPAHWETVIAEGDVWRYIIPTSEPPAAWRSPGFDDASWARGPTGIGYGDGDDRTEVPAGTISVYARKAFEVQDPSEISHVVLDVDFDDAFVAYLNGTEIARENIAGQGRPPAFYEVADTYTEPRLVTGGKLFHYSEERFRGLLRAGENVLAIQVHNTGSGSSDLSLIPFLTLGMRRAPENARGPAATLRSYLPALHTNFRISADGERISLASPDGKVIDFVDTTPLPVDVSMGRFPNGSGPYSYHAPASPGAPNPSPGFLAIGSPVSFSPPGGFHAGPVRVELSHESPAGEIHLTTDGSDPTASSPVYSGPLTVSRTTVVRAKVLGEGVYPRAASTHTYLISRPVTLPVVSISTDPANFFDDELGIYVPGTSYDPNFPYFGANFWEDWERPVHVELYEPDGSLGFSAGAGAKIFGGWSRGNPQRSLALFARSRYGASRFAYRIFPEKRLRSFEAFVLRNSGNDWQVTHFRDALMTSLVDDLGIDRQAYRPAIVFIDGEYWGILNLREKINEHFIAANHEGVEADRIDLLENDGVAIHGDADHYRAMIALVSGGDIQDPGVYAQIEGMVDIENFIDYQAAQIYFDNTDWPGNNVKFWRPRAEGGRWRWILFDTDFGFGLWNPGNYANDTLAFALEPNGPSWPNPPWSTLMLRRLVTNRRFVEDFVNRFATHLNTIFAPGRVVARIDEMARAIEAEMPAQRARWGSSVSAWRSSVQVLRDFASRRVPYVRSKLAARFALGPQALLRANVSSTGGGKIAIQGIPIAAYPFAGTYFQGLPIRLEAVPEPGYRFAGWTGIEPQDAARLSVVLGSGGLTVSAEFELDCSASSDVVINEILYNAPEGADPGDWVELHNRTAAAVDLSGWAFRDSSSERHFTFPAGSRIEGGGYLVLCSDYFAFAAIHPEVTQVLGELGFSLDGSGETLELFDAGGLLVDRVTYDDADPWPEAADGRGASLALKNPLLDNDHGPHWAASLGGGTPGRRNDVYVEVDADCGGGGARFLRGDCDGDGQVSIADPIRLLLVNFAGAPVRCRAACDSDGDGSTAGVGDPIHLLRFLFLGGPAPPPPFPACGAPAFPSDESLGCEVPPAACR